jgi:hypothetical protein
MQAKLYFLMQNLIYPAFAGTLLYNYSQQAWWLITGNLPIDPYWSSPIWLASGLWFLIYFSCAFTEFEEFLDPAAQKRFGKWAFAWNFLEVVVILVAALAINRTADPNQTLPGNPFLWVGICWALIPATGAASNCGSDRQVRTTLSGAVYVVLACAAIAVLGLDFQWSAVYIATLAAMWIFLAAYFLMIWKPDRCLGEMLHRWDTSLNKRLGCAREVREPAREHRA